MKAVDKFEYRRGYKLTINLVIRWPSPARLLTKRTIRIPVHDWNHQ